MKLALVFRGLLSGILAGVLFSCLFLPAAAETPDAQLLQTPEVTDPVPEEFVTPENPMDGLDVRFCFGLLHGHTCLSDGMGTPEEAFAGAKAQNLDFYAVTDHSNSFDNDLSATLTGDAAAISSSWARGKAAAREASDSGFVGLFGFEMTWPDDRNLGHITTFGTPGFLSRNKDGFDALEPYYEALTTAAGSVSQFCHPGPELGEFENFTGRTAQYDAAVALLEIGGEDGFDALDAYITALDAGWHVSPTASHNDHHGNFGSLNDARTVILAESLTEEELYTAMARMRTYATEDRDLRIYYTLDGQVMGSTLSAGEFHTLALRVFDPSDSGGSRLEVLTCGGGKLLACPIPDSGILELTLPGGYDYYFLRLIQADGDIAVTAPVWTESFTDIRIDSFSSDCQTLLPGQRAALTLTLHNAESLPFDIAAVTLRADGVPVCEIAPAGTLDAGQTRSFSIPYTQTEAGAVTLTAEVTGSAGGFPRSICAELVLHFRPRELVKGLLVDLGHSSRDAGDFDALAFLAEEGRMRTTCFTGRLPEDGSILVLPPAETAYEEEFLQQVKIFCAQGGVLVVCGCSEEANPNTAQYQNRLLQSIGSTLILRVDNALDPVHNGGTPQALYPRDFNRDEDLCREITDQQVYAHLHGATVEPGQGSWLVKGGKTTVSSLTGESRPVLLAWETLAAGGHVLAAGSSFLTDDALVLPQNRWDAPTANQSVLDALMGITREPFPITPIAQVRRGRKDTLYHIQGYATSGTSNKYTTFPDTIYLQDDSGGIAVVPFRETGISVGTPMIIAGYLQKDENGNPVLKPVDYHLPEESHYRHVPRTKTNHMLTDYETWGGQLVQAEAEVTSLTLTQDGLGIRRLILTDAWGDDITVVIEDGIFSGAYGTNTLAKDVQVGRTVRAMGLLHLDANGIPVIRVRNCEEVVWVPPVPRPGSRINPYTGDGIRHWAALLTGSASALHQIRRRKKRNHCEKKVD